jgi:hypothetical protein
MQEENKNSLSINCVLTDVNILNVYDLSNWCGGRRLKCNFALGELRERFFNLHTSSISDVFKANLRKVNK